MQFNLALWSLLKHTHTRTHTNIKHSTCGLHIGINMRFAHVTLYRTVYSMYLCTLCVVILYSFCFVLFCLERYVCVRALRHRQFILYNAHIHTFITPHSEMTIWNPMVFDFITLPYCNIILHAKDLNFENTEKT